MKNRTKLTAVQKFENLAKSVSNPKLVNDLITKYQQDTKNAVVNIINMCKTVREINDKVKSGELKEQDLNYFCATVSLDKKSSTFRKFLCIADKSDIFERYLEKVPASYTILYEITTLDSDEFDLLIKSKELNNFITLKDVKRITGKTSASAKTNNSEVIVTLKINPKSATTESLQLVAQCYQYLQNKSDVVVTTSNETLLTDALLKIAA